MPVLHNRQEVGLIGLVLTRIIESEFEALFGYMLFFSVAVIEFAVNKAEFISGFAAAFFRYKVILVIDR